MSLINKITVLLFCLLIVSEASAQEIKKVGKFKDWETVVVTDGSKKLCFAQSKPVLQSPKKDPREARLFISFRPADKIKDEVSVTSGHEYKSASVTATSGKNEFSMFSQGNFAWLIDREEEASLIKTMKKASRLSILAKANNGRQTKDLYSMMGFTKAYNTAKKNCA